VARNKAGIAPLQPALDKIAAIASLSDFQKVMTVDAVTISQPFLGVAAFSNPNNSAINSAYITPGGLGLPNRDFYVNTDEKSTSSASFFCISAVLNPLCTNTLANSINTITIAIIPYSSGKSSRAKTICTINCIPCVPLRSISFHSKEDITCDFVLVISIKSTFQ